MQSPIMAFSLQLILISIFRIGPSKNFKKSEEVFKVLIKLNLLQPISISLCVDG